MAYFNKLYRWCDGYGGGIVFAVSKVEAKAKLVKKYGEERGEFIVWLWTKDEYFDKINHDVFDIY